MKIGFIGTGNMGSGIIKGILNSKFVPNENINIFDLDREKVNTLVREYKVIEKSCETEIVESSDIVILAVKPNVYPVVLKKIRNYLTEKKILLTIAAGFSIEKIEAIIDTDKKIVRTMPNTPAQVLEAMTAVTFNRNITEEEKQNICN